MKGIILHGTGASPEWNWFRWLESELHSHDWQVWVPQLPHPEHPSGREQSEYVRRHVPFRIDNETVIIGHSAGAVVGLVVAQTVKQPVKAVFAVGTPRDNDHLKWQANNRLFDVPFDAEAIRRGAGYVAFVHSDNDPYCPLDQTQDLCERVGGEMFVLPGQKHFNEEAGLQYKRFPWLLNLILEKAGA